MALPSPTLARNVLGSKDALRRLGFLLTKTPILSPKRSQGSGQAACRDVGAYPWPPAATRAAQRATGVRRRSNRGRLTCARCCGRSIRPRYPVAPSPYQYYSRTSSEVCARRLQRQHARTERLGAVFTSQQLRTKAAELSELAGAVKGQIARFLHNHKDDDAAPKA